MLELVLIRGLPGSGKSTLARTLATTHVHLEADMFFLDAQGRYVFDVEQLPQAFQWCLEQTAAVLKRGQSVVVANTFVRNAALAPFFALAQQVGATVRVVEATGNFPNVHGVPETVIQRMRQQWEPLRLSDLLELPPVSNQGAEPCAPLDGERARAWHNQCQQ